MASTLVFIVNAGGGVVLCCLGRDASEMLLIMLCGSADFCWDCCMAEVQWGYAA